MEVSCPIGHPVTVADPDTSHRIVGVVPGHDGAPVTQYGVLQPKADDDDGVERPGMVVKCPYPDPTSPTGLCGRTFFVEVS